MQKEVNNVVALLEPRQPKLMGSTKTYQLKFKQKHCWIDELCQPCVDNWKTLEDIEVEVHSNEGRGICESRNCASWF